jgi:phytoene dehydrogenase-like protein
MKFAVVGGGYTGLMAALRLLQRGHEVEIHEAGEALGGLVRDVVLPHGRFFQGCQYMNLDADLMALCQGIPGAGLTVFPHRYGSWTDLFGPARVHHDFAQPLVTGPLGALPPDRGEPRSLADHLDRFEPRVAVPLLRWAARHGPVGQLTAGNAVPLQIGRVFYADALAAVQQAKRTDVRADRVLGVPRSLFAPPSPVQGAALPMQGFDAFIARLGDELLARGARIHLRSPAKPQLDAQRRCQVLVRQQVVEADAVVWCANPTPLLQRVAGERLDSLPLRCMHLYATLDGEAPETPFYVQTFSARHPLLRLFCYPLHDAAGGPRLTVEALDEGWSLAQLVHATDRVLQDMGWKARIREAAMAPNVRYTLVTQHDAAVLARFAQRAATHGIVTGGWQHYGRNPRLHDVFRQLDAMTATHRTAELEPA